MCLLSCAQHIVRKAAEWGVGMEVLAEMRFDLPKTQVGARMPYAFPCVGWALARGDVSGLLLMRATMPEIPQENVKGYRG